MASTDNHIAAIGDISRNIDEDATITRAPQRLCIFWMPETQNAILDRMHERTHSENVGVTLSERRGLKRAA